MSCIVSLYSMEEIDLVSTNLQSVLVCVFFFLLLAACYPLLSVSLIYKILFEP